MLTRPQDKTRHSKVKAKDLGFKAKATTKNFGLKAKAYNHWLDQWFVQYYTLSQNVNKQTSSSSPFVAVGICSVCICHSIIKGYLLTYLKWWLGHKPNTSEQWLEHILNGKYMLRMLHALSKCTHRHRTRMCFHVAGGTELTARGTWEHPT